MILLISAWKNSGKDTVAAHLKEVYGFNQLSFAGVLKDMVADEYNIPREWLDDRDLKEAPLLQYPVKAFDSFSKKIHDLLKHEVKRLDGSTIASTGNSDFYFTPRALCILKGSVNRAVDTNYWVNRVSSQCNKLDKVVISDFRYKSEYSSLSRLANKPIHTLRINRFTTVDTTDPSERDLDNFNFDYAIDNKGTLEELYTKIDNLAKYLKLDV